MKNNDEFLSNDISLLSSIEIINHSQLSLF